MPFSVFPTLIHQIDHLSFLPDSSSRIVSKFLSMIQMIVYVYNRVCDMACNVWLD